MERATPPKRKIIDEVFNDYEDKTNIVKCEINNVKMFKKANKLELEIVSNNIVEVKELANFENYLRKRFQIKEVDVRIKYEHQIEDHIIEEQWKDALWYISLKYPFAKVILKNCIMSIQQNKVSIKLKVKGAEFLIARGIVKVLEEFFFSQYNRNLKVDIFEELDEKVLQALEESAKLTEKLIVSRAQEAAQEALNEEQNELKPNKDENKKEEEKQEEEIKLEENQTIEEEKTPLILGRSLNIRENVVKIEDLTIDSGKIALEGEVLNLDSRELKSGKFLILYDVYDGTSTITCKSFVEAEKAKNVISRIKQANGVRLAGTAQFDPFAKELGVIANVIIETEGRKKHTRMDNAKEKRVELHMHTQMSQMDGMTSATDLIKRAMKWGMKSIAITDHGVVQAFPEAHKLLGRDNPDMKVIYGVEA